MGGVMIAVQLISIAIGLAVVLTQSQSSNAADEEVDSPTADEGIAFGMVVGKSLMSVNTIAFEHSGSRSVKSKGK